MLILTKKLLIWFILYLFFDKMLFQYAQYYGIDKYMLSLNILLILFYHLVILKYH